MSRMTVPDATAPPSESLIEKCKLISTLFSKRVELLNSATREKVQKDEGVLRKVFDQTFRTHVHGCHKRLHIEQTSWLRAV